ncbi:MULTISPECIES: hypothetical protein [Clavibacter]|uniref:WXG100 family type VII secretion target n=1 Tax=Clavibacter tessellarius TaxID=31965 RepID=A0A154V3M1_9MICO|nr:MULTISPECIES: hypothetical protein [Clavibacter]KZC95849.1 hypothetical protein AWH51_05880 [Clavibacter michiganensis subsp. tessellarius]MDA3806039.1 hypothetical protein [Clavibacter sp. CT19]
MTSSDPADRLSDIPSAADVETAAAAFDKIGAAMDEAMQSITRSWSGLSAVDVFDTPDSARLFDALSSAQTLSRTLGEDAAAAKAALLAYSTSLADLPAKRKEAADSLAADKSSEVATAIPLAPGIIDGFNNEVDHADEECAEALLKLTRYAGDALVDAVQGIGETLEQPALKLGIDGGTDLIKDSPKVKDAFHAVTDLLGITEQDGNHTAEPVVDGAQPASERLTAAGDEALGRRVAEVGAAGEGIARGLGAAGVLVSGAAAFANTYDHDEAEHPDWNPTERATHATTHAAVVAVGGVAGSIVGGEIGTVAGEGLGAVVGSAVFPPLGTVVGAEIGGFLGGLAGGYIGDKIGSTSGEGFTNFVDHFFG